MTLTFSNPRLADTMTEHIQAWSYSRLLDFEGCAFKAYLKVVKHEPDPSGPAAERGTQVHDAAEQYVNGKRDDLIPELRKFSTEFEVLRAQYKAGCVSLEGEWAMDEDWAPTPWRDKRTWVRMKLDACVFRGDKKDNALVIDYKTGKKYGNEIKHTEQGQLYAVGVAMRNPEIQKIDVEFWYTDQDDILDMHYTRAEALKFVRPFTRRGKKMTAATEFPPNPNVFTCKWCPYKPSAGGQCKVGVG